ncbi:hypothetical protein ACFSOZ_25970 [Mesorhizobium newzealandense]|uniref:Uncharacterized protein n=1 Tax=Mesorhizobium newzealandense TaxID=1300302 RepID=A0ABW4UEK9_9HYPH
MTALYGAAEPCMIDGKLIVQFLDFRSRCRSLGYSDVAIASVTKLGPALLLAAIDSEVPA